MIKGKTRDKAVEAVLDHFRNEDLRQDFYEFFNELSAIYEILSPDSFLRPYIEDYDTLARMFKILREAYDPGISVDREFTRKTAKLVQEHTESGEIKSTLEIYEINEHTLRKLQKDTASDTEKVFNLIRSIEATVKKGANTSPYLHSIGEKAEIISLLYQQRQIDTQDALEKARRVIDEINQAKKEQVQKDLPTELFSIYWVLRDQGIENPEEKATSMKPIFENYPYWRTSEEYERKLKQEMLKIFIKAKMGVKKSVELTNKILNVLKSGTE